MALHSKSSVAARTKDMRLKGSDLYVARLGSCHKTPPKSSRLPAQTPAHLPISSLSSSVLSLHDELSPFSRTPSLNEHTDKSAPVTSLPEIRESRPCYRCVTAMHSVGIKRVFWTNHDGRWEGAKVRDLIDALETGISAGEDGVGTGPQSKGIFVTKHEVLMLKRMMDSSG